MSTFFSRSSQYTNTLYSLKSQLFTLREAVKYVAFTKVVGGRVSRDLNLGLELPPGNRKKGYQANIDKKARIKIKSRDMWDTNSFIIPYCCICTCAMETVGNYKRGCTCDTLDGIFGVQFSNVIPELVLNYIFPNQIGDFRDHCIVGNILPGKVNLVKSILSF